MLRFRDGFRKVKREAKAQFSDWLQSTAGQTVDPDTIFDCQIKRIHEYKRQLLNALRIIVQYNRLRANPDMDIPPRTFFFAGKAAPAYHLAKLIIKFINNLAGTIDGDPVTRGRLKVVFLPDYNVALAERLIPAADVSNQISTAGYEASGTSNMKFMMNGALTIGTRDGATIEMAQEAGEDNFFLFGLSARAGCRKPLLVQSSLALRQRARNPGCARPDLLQLFQPLRARDFRAAPRRATGAWRSLHASGGSDRVSRGRPPALRTLWRRQWMGGQGDSERCRLREVLQRSNHLPIRDGNLERQTLSGPLIDRQPGTGQGFHRAQPFSRPARRRPTPRQPSPGPRLRWCPGAPGL